MRTRLLSRASGGSIFCLLPERCVGPSCRRAAWTFRRPESKRSPASVSLPADLQRCGTTRVRRPESSLEQRAAPRRAMCGRIPLARVARRLSLAIIVVVGPVCGQRVGSFRRAPRRPRPALNSAGFEYLHSTSKQRVVGSTCDAPLNCGHIRSDPRCSTNAFDTEASAPAERRRSTRQESACAGRQTLVIIQRARTACGNL